jgi:hypothetical protein
MVTTYTIYCKNKKLCIVSRAYTYVFMSATVNADYLPKQH